MNKVAKTTILLMVITIISKILGLGRELSLGTAYGASSYSDAYLVAMNIPGVLLAILGTVISTTFIPLYYEAKNEGEHICSYFTNNILNIICIASIIMATVSFVFAEKLVNIFAIGFSGEALVLAIKFTKVLSIGIIFNSINYVMTSFMQSNESFIIPGLVGIPFNLIIIISIVISTKTNPYVMVYGTVLAIISQFLFQLPFAYKKGFRYRINININDKYIKKIYLLVGPIFIGVAVNQINLLVDRSLASTLVEGSISALNYASRLNSFVTGLFIATIASVIYPVLSKLSSENDKEQFNQSIIKSINTIILLVIPISIGAIVLSTPIVRLLFERGAFDERATNMTSIALVFYSVGMTAGGLRDILGKVFYSLQDTKTPMINGTIAMIMNIILNFILVKFMGHAGLAFATSISSVICIFMLFNSLKRKIGYFGQDKIIKTMIKSLISAIVMGIVTYFVYNILANILGVGFIEDMISLLGAVGIGAIVYGVLIIILKVEGVNIITDMVKRKISA